MTIQSILDLKNYLLEIKNSSLGVDTAFATLIPDEAAFNVIKAIAPILKKFADVCDVMSGKKYPSFCWIIHNPLKCTIDQCTYKSLAYGTNNNYILQMCCNMLADMKKRWLQLNFFCNCPHLASRTIRICAYFRMVIR